MKKKECLYYVVCLCDNDKIGYYELRCKHKIKSFDELDDIRGFIATDLGADIVTILNIIFIGKERR